MLQIIGNSLYILKRFSEMVRLKKLQGHWRARFIILIFVACVHLSEAEDNGKDIQPRAEVEGSDEGFAKSIWGAYLFSILGIAAVVIIAGLLLNFLTGSRSKSRGDDGIANPNHRFQPQEPRSQERNNALLNEQPRFSSTQQPQPVNPTAHVPYIPPPTIQQQSPSLSYPPYSPPPNEFESNRFNRNAMLPPSSSPPPALDTKYSPQPNNIGFIVPTATPPSNYEKSAQPGTSSQYQYLDNFAPYAPPSSTQVTEDSIIPKRAVLRSKTPYKVVEEKAKLDAEGEDGIDSPLRSPNDSSYNYNSTNYQFQNDAFNSYPEEHQSMYHKNPTNTDGLVDSRFVRVLPRYPPAAPPKRQAPMPPTTVGFHI